MMILRAWNSAPFAREDTVIRTFSITYSVTRNACDHTGKRKNGHMPTGLDTGLLTERKRGKL